MEAVRGGAGLLWESTVVKVYLESLHTLLRIQAGFIHTSPTVFFFHGSHSWAYTNFVTELEVRL